MDLHRVLNLLSAVTVMIFVLVAGLFVTVILMRTSPSLFASKPELNPKAWKPRSIATDLQTETRESRSNMAIISSQSQPNGWVPRFWIQISDMLEIIWPVKIVTCRMGLSLDQLPGSA